MSQDLYQELLACIRRAKELVKEQRVDGQAKAEAEYKYRIAAAQCALRLKQSGHPATLVDTLVKGDSACALLRKERDVAEVIYKAGISAQIQNQTEVRILEAQLDREYRG
jgi:hypothetical protein